MTALSPGIITAVRKLVDARCDTDAEARETAERLWPRADWATIETIVANWRGSRAPKPQEPDEVIKVTPIGGGRVRDEKSPSDA